MYLSKSHHYACNGNDGCTKAMLNRIKYSNKQDATYNWEQSNSTAANI